MRSPISTLPFLLGIVAAVTNSTASNSTAGNCPTENRGSSIRWGLCDEAIVNGTLPMDCATLRVPLDYSNASSKDTILLNLARVPAGI